MKNSWIEAMKYIKTLSALALFAITVFVIIWILYIVFFFQAVLSSTTNTIPVNQ